ncbi:uncharacterized protein LOC107047746 [Diachasma alloeum]|uniref:uncharacterized protein LOC107047746 n=1 Tax=Diachasma alloeum TaxID=454923 RepID=UPI0007384057|nr:uncharacterized protein LOC107047746 [Diachasma alloeum]
MEANDFKNSQSSSTTEDGTSSKRQKLRFSPLHSSSTDSGPLNDHQLSNISNLEKELAALHVRLLHTSTIVNEFQRKKKQIENVLEEEAKNLEVELEVDKEMIKQVEVRLATQIRSSQSSHGSQTTFDSEMIQLKARMNQRIKNLLSATPRMISSSLEGTLSSTKVEENESEVGKKLEAAEKRIKMELEEILDDHWILQGFDSQSVDFEETRLKLQKLNSIRAFWDEKPTSPLSTPGEVDQVMMTDGSEVSILQQSGTVLSQKIEKLKSLVGDLHNENERFRQEFEELEEMRDVMRGSVERHEEQVIKTDHSPDAAGHGDPSGEEPGAGDADEFLFDWTAGKYADSQMIQEELPAPGSGEISGEICGVGDGDPSSVGGQQEKTPVADLPTANDEDAPQVESIKQNLPIKVSEFCVLPSNPKWFEIDWEREYTQDVSREYICNTCSLIVENKMRIQDHVWVTHFGGGFKCPVCPDSARALTRRYSIGAHMRSKHPNDLPPWK